MTLNDLIDALRKLQEEGYGEVPVRISERKTGLCDDVPYPELEGEVGDFHVVFIQS